ncbi:MAG: amidohydrolase family protein [Pseudomonadota bacterium]
MRITNVNIFDGRQVRAERSVDLADGSISALAATGAQSDTFDGEDGWLIPGLIDCHVHMELDPADKTPPAPDAPRDLDAMAERAGGMVRAGITTARDLGGGAWAEIELRDRIAAGTVIGPRLLCAGQPITSVGGHCHFWGGEATTVEEGEAVFARQLEHGADLLKIMATGGRFTPDSKPSKAQFPLAFIQAMVAAADAAGVHTAAHCHGSEGIDFAARAGITTIEHCSWVGDSGKWASDFRPDVVAEMARRGTWVSPTINAGWQRFLDSGSDMVKTLRGCFDAMRAAGVRLVASTDAGIPGVWHKDLPKAVGVFARIAGLTNAEAITSATADAASAIGLGGTTGAIASGLSADLLLLPHNPLDDLAALTEPAAVWARGERVL